MVNVGSPLAEFQRWLIPASRAAWSLKAINSLERGLVDDDLIAVSRPSRSEGTTLMKGIKVMPTYVYDILLTLSAISCMLAKSPITKMTSASSILILIGLMWAGVFGS